MRLVVGGRPRRTSSVQGSCIPTVFILVRQDGNGKGARQTDSSPILWIPLCVYGYLCGAPEINHRMRKAHGNILRCASMMCSVWLYLLIAVFLPGCTQHQAKNVVAHPPSVCIRPFSLFANSDPAIPRRPGRPTCRCFNHDLTGFRRRLPRGDQILIIVEETKTKPTHNLGWEFSLA